MYSFFVNFSNLVLKIRKILLRSRFCEKYYITLKTLTVYEYG